MRHFFFSLLSRMIRWGATVALGALLTTWGVTTVWPIRDVRLLHANCGIVFGEFRVHTVASGNLRPNDAYWSDLPLNRSRVPWPFVAQGSLEIEPSGGPKRSGKINTVGIPIWMTVVPLAAAVVGLWRPAWVRSRRLRRGCCPGCGYDLTGNRSSRCPECGATVSARKTIADSAKAGGCAET